MQFKVLGNSDIKVSAIGLGTMGLGGWYDAEPAKGDAVQALIGQAVELGINWFDTAEVYAQGYTEELLGKALSKNRHDVIIASKFATENSSRADVVAAAEGSLRRLATDHIDIYQNHWPNAQVPWEETIQGLDDLVRAGKIRAVALGNITASDITKIKALMPSGFPLIAVQQEYNLTERFVEHGILPACRAENLSLIAYSPLARGALCAPENALKLETVAAKYGLTPAQVSLQWIARQNDVVAVPMTSNPSHLEANAKSLDRLLDDQDMNDISAIFALDLQQVPVDRVDVVASHTGATFTNIEDARNNTLGLSPSPADLARELIDGDILKPVKLRKNAERPGRYDLYEGQLRYWAWTIAHDGKRPILAQVKS